MQSYPNTLLCYQTLLLRYYDIVVLLPIAYCLYPIALFRVQRHHFQYTRSNHPARCMLCSIAMPASSIVDPITQLDACSVASLIGSKWLHLWYCKALLRFLGPAGVMILQRFLLGFVHVVV